MSSLRSSEELLAVADEVLRHAPRGVEAELTATESSTALTRFANGAIHQNVSDTSLRLRLRLVAEGRSGVAEMQADGDGVAAALVARTEAIRTRVPAGEPVRPLPPDGGRDTSIGFSEATVAATPEQRAETVAVVCEAARRESQLAYGSCETAETSVAIVNSLGLRRAARRSVAELIAVCRGEEGSAYAARLAADTATIDAAEVAAEVTDRCARNRGATAVEPGSYEVVLAPYATASLLEYLGMLGLGGLAVLEQRSFMRFGERLMSDAVTIVDDVRHPELTPLPFDGEGATTQPVTIVDRGVCTAVVHDSVTASRAGTTTTGHSFAQPNEVGPLPSHLCMEAGDSDSEAMIAACELGLLVTRFWYVRAVHPMQTIVTGMTRDGTFLIRKGRVVGPVRDLRFTQSIVGALADVRGLGAERLAVRGFFGAALTPWLHLGHFTFSS